MRLLGPDLFEVHERAVRTPEDKVQIAYEIETE